MNCALIALASLMLVGSTIAQTGLPAALKSAIETTTVQRPEFSFDLEIASAKLNWRARFDPAHPRPKLRLVSPDRSSMNNQQRAAFDRQAEDVEGVTWCANEYMGRIANVVLVREDHDTATYSFQPTRDSVRDERAKGYARELRGEVTLIKSRPDIAAIRTYAPAAFSPAPLVRITALDIRISCAAAPNGRNYVATVETLISGSAFGQNFSDRSVQRIFNLREAP